MRMPKKGGIEKAMWLVDCVNMFLLSSFNYKVSNVWKKNVTQVDQILYFIHQLPCVYIYSQWTYIDFPMEIRTEGKKLNI